MLISRKSLKQKFYKTILRLTECLEVVKRDYGLPGTMLKLRGKLIPNC